MVSTCCRHPGHLWITQPGAREAANNGTPRFRGDHCARRYLITTSARAPTVYALVTGCSSSIAAALGGMLMPALIYIAFTAGTPLIHGWGIPMATDTAFAVGVLALLHRHIPAGLTAFLTALAIIDDLGAILVIAVFYTETINLPFLAAAMLLILLLILLNAAGIRRPVVYFLIGGLVCCPADRHHPHDLAQPASGSRTTVGRRADAAHRGCRTARRHGLHDVDLHFQPGFYIGNRNPHCGQNSHSACLPVCRRFGFSLVALFGEGPGPAGRLNHAPPRAANPGMIFRCKRAGVAGVITVMRFPDSAAVSPPRGH